MKLTHGKHSASQPWLLLAYTLCIFSIFGMQHHTGRQIVTGIAAGVVVLVAVLFVRSRVQGGCAA